MTKLSVNELKMAKSMVLWFVGGDGETSIEHLAYPLGIEPDDLYAWAVGRRFMFQGDDVALMDMLPFIWEDFSSSSRLCLALHTALQEMIISNAGAKIWVRECCDGLERHKEVYGHKRA